jgi:hypothetical protein
MDEDDKGNEGKKANKCHGGTSVAVRILPDRSFGVNRPVMSMEALVARTMRRTYLFRIFHKEEQSALRWQNGGDCVAVAQRSA